MTYEYPGSGKLDPFTLGMMRDVLREHPLEKDHGSGWCCQVAASYERRVAEHEAIVAGRKEATKAGAPIFNPLSERQGNYIRSLARRTPLHLLAPETRSWVEMVQAQNEITKDQAKQSIDELLSVQNAAIPSDSEARATRLITSAQLGFLKKLLATRQHNLELDLANLGDLPFTVASKHITDLKAAPYKADADGQPQTARQARNIPEDGFYFANEKYFKVVTSERTGNTTARIWLHDEEKWEYVGQQPFRFLTSDKKLSTEEAAAFGKLYHRCVFCTKQLTRQESEDAGYGPDCAEKYNLPWG